MLNVIKEGTELPAISKQITQENINNYAELSGATDSIHIDPEYAAKTEFKSTLAHGLMLAGYISEVLYESFGEPWLSKGTMNIKFVSPVKVDEQISTKGSIEKIQILGKIKKVTSTITCFNEKGPVVVAAATVDLDN